MAGLAVLSALGYLLVEANPWGSAASREYAKSAHAKRVTGDLESAYTIYDDGYREALRTNNSAGQIRFLNSLGGCRYIQYQYQDALRHWLEGRRLAEKFPQEAEEHGALLFNLASLYYASSNREAAEEAVREGNERLKGLRKVPYYAARLQLIRAAIAARSGSWTEALQHYRSAIESADIAGDDATLSLALNHFATAHLSMSDWDNAERYFLSAYRIRKFKRDPYLIYTYLGLATLELARDNLPFAHKLVDAAQRLADELDRPMARHQIHEVRAKILAGQQRHREAHLEYMRAIANIRYTRADLLPADMFRVNNEASLADLYEAMLRNAMNWQRTGEAPAALATEAWFAAEEWKASVANRTEADRRTLKSRLSPQYWQALAEVRQLEQKSIAAAGRTNPSDAGEHRLRSLRVRLAEMESYAGVRPFSGVFTENFTTSKPLILFRDGLGPDSVLISFHLGPKVAIRWTLTKDRLDWKELPSREGLAKLAEMFGQAVRGAFEQERARLSRELYEKLFGGLSSEALRAKNWLLALDGALLQLPVAVLTGDESGEKGASRFLIEVRSLEIVSGAQALLSHEAGDWNGVFVGVGDAVYNTADPRWRKAGAPLRGGSFWGFPMAADVAWEQPGETGAIPLPRLPSSRGELEASAKAWGQSGLLLMGDDANRQKAVDAIEAGAAVVHFATHFMRKEASPDRALLVLSLDSKGKPEFFSPSDTVHVKVPESLVVLSGCHSAAGAQIPAAGLIGLTRAWLFAGARGVIASLWSTPDDTGAIFQTFYRELQKEALSSNRGGVLTRTSARQRGMTLRNAAEALRRAQLEMLRTQTWRALPKYWGTYQLIGRTT